jgi:hypothetical protein
MRTIGWMIICAEFLLAISHQAVGQGLPSGGKAATYDGLREDVRKSVGRTQECEKSIGAAALSRANSDRTSIATALLACGRLERSTSMVILHPSARSAGTPGNGALQGEGSRAILIEESRPTPFNR